MLRQIMAFISGGILSPKTQITDPLVHGAYGDVSYANFIRESELRLVCKNTVDVICFMDRLHLDYGERVVQQRDCRDDG
jgi:hypothetical protein